MKRAVITGCTGMLGLALIRKLLSEGYEVVAVIRPDSKRADNIPEDERITVVELPLEDIGMLPSVLKPLGIENASLFFHFAWGGTSGAARNDMELQKENIAAALKAVDAAHELGCEAFLGAGSQAEYGRVPDGTKLSGKTPCDPENGYGIAKYAAGKMTRVKAQSLGMKHIWVRILSTYGEFDGAHTMVMSMVSNFIDGNRASCTKGEQMWDYLYCDDAANAFYLAATKGVDGKVYPVGSGIVRPLADYIRDIRDAIDPDLEIGFGEVDYYPGQVMYLCADIAELTEDTGFKPEYTFKEGIERTINWYKARKNS